MSSRNYLILITFLTKKNHSLPTTEGLGGYPSGVDQGEDQNICRRNVLTGTEDIEFKWFQMKKKNFHAPTTKPRLCFHLFERLT